MLVKITTEPCFLAVGQDSNNSLVPTSTFCLTWTNEEKKKNGINNPFILIHIKACEPAHQRSFMHANPHSGPVRRPGENLLSLHSVV